MHYISKSSSSSITCEWYFLLRCWGIVCGLLLDQVKEPIHVFWSLDMDLM